MSNRKKPTGFRLSSASYEALPALAGTLGLSQASTVEYLLRASDEEGATDLYDTSLRVRMGREREKTHPLIYRSMSLSQEAIDILSNMAFQAGLTRTEVIELLVLSAAINRDLL